MLNIFICGIVIITYATSSLIFEYSFGPKYVEDFVTKHGYPLNIYSDIRTEDGYLLELHRIPYGKNKTTALSYNKPIAFLMHGIVGSSAHWLITENSLAFLLADMGYDVWLGNARGCLYSRKHETLNPDTDPKFWQFSFNEIGVYDLPAMIDYVLKVTNNDMLYYIGDSQGCTDFFAMASTKPEYNKKIKLMIALAPASYMTHMQPPFSFLTILENDLNILRLSMTEIVGGNQLFEFLKVAFCIEGNILDKICTNGVFLLTGYDPKQLNDMVIPLMFRTTPSGFSIQQMLHFFQIRKSRRFRKYDYGMVKNMILYGQSEPPDYKLKAIDAPIALFFAQRDNIVSIKDVARLSKELPNCVLKYLVPYKNFNHLDFLSAIDVVELLYNKVFEIMKMY